MADAQQPYEPGQNLRVEQVRKVIRKPKSKASLRTPERATAILSALQLGATRNAAAAAGGMSRMSLWRWVTESEDMAKLVEEAEGQAELRALAAVRAAAATTWQAAAWWLERRRPTAYGRKDRMDVHVEARTLAADYARAEGFDEAEIIAEAQKVLEAGRERNQSEPDE